jgi:catechol 2,3-dioxygenase-like lactoylglutathione lyase family enzyme
MVKLVPELAVSSFARSLAFYTEICGFSVLYARPEERFAYLNLESAQIMIEEHGQEGLRSWFADTPAYPYGRGMNLQIEVDAVDRLYDACRAAGTKIFLEMEEKWYRRDSILLGVRQFIVLDPDGYLLRFSESLGEKPV